MREKSASKRDEVYLAIRRDIISGVLKPGEIVNEAGLADKFGVSKSPVREALGTLAFEQLVSPLPRVGYSVTQITLRDVQEMFALRELLEVECAGLAADRIGSDEVQALERLGPVYKEDPYLDTLDTNREWHLTVARIAGNRRFVELVERVLDDMARMLILDPKMSSWHSSAEVEHIAVIEALRNRDKEAAREAMRRHLECSKSRILELL